MSAQNVEIVLRNYDAFNRRDADAVFADYHPEIEYRLARSLEGSATLSGREQIKTVMLQVWELFPEGGTEPEETYDLGDEVLVRSLEWRVGRDGIRIEERGGQLWTLEDGLVVRFEAFMDWAEALEAAGLGERAP